MSPRTPSDRQQIERFLRALGERFRHPGRLYLVGGTTMVFEGLRAQSIDIDITFEVDSSHHGEFVQTIRKLKDELDVNVEESSPSDFIPLPRGASERAIFVGRFGQLDVFHFDYYSISLSKIARGTQEDFSDILSLLQSRRIELLMLEKYYQEIRPRVASESLKQDPKEFDRNFEMVRRSAREENLL